MPDKLSRLLRRTGERHDHLCPRQVLGVRMGLAGRTAMGWADRLSSAVGVIILETDGCLADGIEVATGATVGHRTLRVNDLGKIAATFADVRTARALRIWPRQQVRDRACEFAPEEKQRYAAQLQGYQRMPACELLHIQSVTLTPHVVEILSHPAVRAVCTRCGEEIFNQRELLLEGKVLCRQCAGSGYEVVDLGAEHLRNLHGAEIA